MTAAQDIQELKSRADAQDETIAALTERVNVLTEQLEVATNRHLKFRSEILAHHERLDHRITRVGGT